MTTPVTIERNGVTCTLHNCDCVEFLNGFPDGSCQLCVTSPPYDSLRTYGGHSWDFEALAVELYRVMCEGGIACWNVGDSVVDGSESLTSMRQANGDQKEKKRNIISEFGMRGNVWRCKTAGQENVCTAIDHPAVMPSGLCRDLILSWSNTGDTVLDPFLGSGTTAFQSFNLNRSFVGSEIHADYFKASVERIQREANQGVML